jgi:hypothetical protein
MQRLDVKPLLICAVALTIGCQSRPATPPPFIAPPASDAQVSHFIGTPLSGATPARPTPISAADALTVSVRFVALEHMPAQAGEPLATKARLIIATRRNAPILPAPSLTRPARWIGSTHPADVLIGVIPTAGTIADIAQSDGVLPPGVTASFALTDAATLSDPAFAEPLHRSVEVQLYRPPAGPAGSAPLQLALILEDLAPPPSGEKTDLHEAAPPSAPAAPQQPKAGKSAAPVRTTPAPIAPPTPPAPPVFQRELALIDLPALPPKGETAALIVPIHFQRTDATAVAAIVSIEPASNTPAHMAAVARCSADLAKSADEAANRPELLAVVSPPWSRFRVSLDALTDTQHRRAALVYLAAATGAGLCRDAALTADDDALGHLIAAVRAAVAQSSAAPTPPDGPALGWTLDRATFQWLAAMLADSKLPPELSAVLTAYAGEAGRDAGAIDEISRALATRQLFENQLLAENLIYLEDNSLAARACAFDWLAARGQAPPGYQPDGTAKSRREALAKFVSAGATQ